MVTQHSPLFAQIGNDIVAWDEVGNVNPRFARRIMGDEEFLAYEQNKSPTLLWQTWAAKETAFKFLRQKDPNIRFLPRRFVYHQQTQTVAHGNDRVPMQFAVTDAYVHGYAVTANASSVTAVADMRAVLARHNENTEQKKALSIAARLLIREKAGEHWKKNFDEFEVRKNAYGIPRLFDRKHRYAMSISHHGIYVAVAFITEKLQGDEEQ